MLPAHKALEEQAGILKVLFKVCIDCLKVCDKFLYFAVKFFYFSRSLAAVFQAGLDMRFIGL